MELKLSTKAGSGSSIELSDAVFARDFNEALIHQVVTAYMAGARAGTKAQKNRSAVRGGGAKPWRQKGTGRARAGSRTSPLWRGGGTIFGPKPRDYRYRLPKKVRRLALKMALSARLSEGNMVVIDSLGLTEIKTRDFVSVMKNFQFDDCLVVTPDKDPVLIKSARNAVGYKVMPVIGLNVYDILKYSKLMLVKDSIGRLEERLMV